MDVKSLIILKCFCLLILYFNPYVEGDVPFGMCANPTCSVPISQGVTTLPYLTPDGEEKLSIGINEEVEIYVKEYGPKKDLLGVQSKGIKGYISRSFVKETATFKRNLVPAIFDFRSSAQSSADVVSSQVYHHDSVPTDGIGISTSFVHSEMLQNSINSLHSDSHQQWSSPSESLQSSQVSGYLPSSGHAHVDLHSHFDQSSDVLNFAEQSSHFDLNSDNFLTSSDVTGLRSENLSPQFQTPDISHSSLHQDHLQPSYTRSSFNEPDFQYHSSFHVHSQDFDYDPTVSMGASSLSQQSVHRETIQPPYFDSSHYDVDVDDDDDDDDELSKTFAMLSKRGVDNTGMYFGSLSDSNIGLPNQNNEMKFETMKAKPTESQSHPPVQTSDTLFSSKVDFNPTTTEINKLPSFETANRNENSAAKLPEVNTYSSINEENKVNKEKIAEESEEEQNDILAETNNDEEIADADNNMYYKKFGVKQEKKDENLMPNLEPSINYVSTSPPENFKSATENSNMNTAEVLVEKSKMYEEEYLFSVNSVSTSPPENSKSTLENSGMNTAEILAKKSKVNEKAYLSSINSVSASPPENSKSTIEKSNMITAEIITKKSKMNQEHISVSDVSSHLSESKSIDSFTPQSESYPSTLENSVGEIVTFSDSISKSSDGKSVFATPTADMKEFVHSDTSSESQFDSQDIPYSEDVKDISPKIHTVTLQKESVHMKDNSSSEIQANDHNSESTESLNIGVGLEDHLSSTYQTRNLKGEHIPSEDHQSDSENNYDENNTEPGSSFYSPFENGLDSIKSFVDSVMSWVPDPFYSAVMDLRNKGISPRVPVFTALCGFIIILLIVPVYYIKERSRESKLSVQLVNIEKKAYTLSAANTILEEKLECAKSEIDTLQESLNEARTESSELKFKFEKQTEEFEGIKSELDSCLEEFDSMRAKENEYLSLLKVQNKEKEDLMDHKNSLEKIIKDQEDSITNLTEQLQESEDNLKELEKEKTQYIQMKDDYEEKLAQFELNCNQLLQEAEVWNLRVNELTSNLNDERALKEEIEASLKLKDEEIESLKQLVEIFKMFDEIEDPDELEKTKAEKLQTLMESSTILNQLKKQQDESKVLTEQLGKEKEKILEMEVDMLEAKSEIDKLKLSYNQALQDKAEAQTKLDVLTNYFKDKEIQLQKQLGAQEAVRQKKEEDANSAERRICLIEQENSSYKYQVASMKQEMEETERNLKSQIAAQEKKAHENWIAARAAERKLEDMKQEVTQLRQRLTLLEREQENWVNSTRDEIVRPVPKRMPGMNDESGSQDLNASERGMFHPSLDRMPPPPPHMILPPDRPLPPLPPPPIPPMFLPPIERHFRPQPWHIPPDSSSDFRTTPPEFVTGRESTPPRERPSAVIDGDTGPHASSPLTTDTRDSRNSTPPHLLPDFHDVPPQHRRPYFPPPPPLGHPRLHMHPSYRRDVGPGHKRLDNPNEYNSRGSQQPPASSQEQWQHSRV